MNGPPFKILKLPKMPGPPDHMGRCGMCSKWLFDGKVRVLPTDQGNIPVADLITQGIKYDQSAAVTVAHCTHLPMWSPMTDDHWCHQWDFDRSRLKRDGVPSNA